MMTRVSMVALLVTSLGAAPPFVPRCYAGEPAAAIADVVAKVQASVVRIIVVNLPKVADDRDKDAAAETLPATLVGSGFVIDPERPDRHQPPCGRTGRIDLRLYV